MRTTLHTYSFDVSKPDEAKQYNELFERWEVLSRVESATEGRH
jgi:hypothetical protein